MEYPSNIQTILSEARQAPKGDWFAYERFKLRIRKVAEHYREYEKAIQNLTRILEV